MQILYVCIYRQPSVSKTFQTTHTYLRTISVCTCTLNNHMYISDFSCTCIAHYKVQKGKENRDERKKISHAENSSSSSSSSSSRSGRGSI